MAKNDFTVTDKFVFFWSGPFSQWHRGNFTYNGLTYNTAEQAMMADKARHFKDNDTLKKIMASNSPKEQKAYGRQVSPFDAGNWDKASTEYVYQINIAKFSADKELAKMLLDTGDKILVEASPYDNIWGIGMAADDSRALDIDQWQGQNRLGEVLMRVRTALKEQAR
jgi:ribA/ribD-fused uncharacterized protein